MYASEIVTPNAIRFPEETRESLVEAAGTNEAPGFIANAPDPQAAIAEVTQHIQDHVRRSLYFVQQSSEYAGDPSDTYFQRLCEHQQTDCVGFTLVGSEVLSLAGIKHYIAYANRHMFLARLSKENETGLRLVSVDMCSPTLNQDMTDAISYASPASIESQIQKKPYEHSAAMLDTSKLASNIGQNVETLAAKYPWLRMRRSNYLAPRPQRDDDFERHQSEYRCVTTFYSAETGRQVIGHYIEFRQAVMLGETALALTELDSLRGRYPESDCRASHSEIRSLIQQMCLNDSFRAQVPQAIDNYCSSLRTNDARATGLRAELFRKAAVITRNPEAAREAARLYEVASNQVSSQYPNIIQTYRKKSQKLSAMAQQN